MINYEAAAEVIDSVDCVGCLGWDDKLRLAREAIAAALGDEPLYVRKWNEHADDDWPGQYENFQVWPESDETQRVSERGQ